MLRWFADFETLAAGAEEGCEIDGLRFRFAELASVAVDSVSMLATACQRGWEKVSSEEAESQAAGGEELKNGSLAPAPRASSVGTRAFRRRTSTPPSGLDSVMGLHDLHTIRSLARPGTNIGCGRGRRTTTRNYRIFAILQSTLELYNFVPTPPPRLRPRSSTPWTTNHREASLAEFRAKFRFYMPPNTAS